MMPADNLPPDVREALELTRQALDAARNVRAYVRMLTDANLDRLPDNMAADLAERANVLLGAVKPAGLAVAEMQRRRATPAPAHEAATTAAATAPTAARRRRRTRRRPCDHKDAGSSAGAGAAVSASPRSAVRI